jgi:hypothetical protein
VVAIPDHIPPGRLGAEVDLGTHKHGPVNVRTRGEMVPGLCRDTDGIAVTPNISLQLRPWSVSLETFMNATEEI